MVMHARASINPILPRKNKNSNLAFFFPYPTMSILRSPSLMLRNFPTSALQRQLKDATIRSAIMWNARLVPRVPHGNNQRYVECTSLNDMQWSMKLSAFVLRFLNFQHEIELVAVHIKVGYFGRSQINLFFVQYRF